MKHFFVTVISLIAVLSILPFGVVAQSPAVVENEPVIISESVEELADGNSFLITVAEEQPQASYSVMAAAATTTKIGTKTYSLRNSAGTVLWQFTVRGTFSINPGVSATCTANSYTTNIVDGAWQKQSATSSRSGNKAIGDATFVRKILFVTIETKSCHVILTCDANGNLS